MVTRTLLPLLRRRLRGWPAVGLVGPRQAGKTTLARALGGDYFDLEQESERLRLDLQWDALARGRRLAILDEAQSWPEVFPRLRGAIDADRRRRGRFLLLGSVSPALMTQVSESLAGRLSMVELPPFLACELPNVPLKRLWLRGGYPDGGVLRSGRFPQWQRDYLSLLAQRDLPAWGLPAKPRETERLLAMLAANHGQLWNASQIGQSMGLSYHTVNSYLDYLEGAFLVRRLQPYHANLSKRLVKSQRVYWRDPGLLHALLNVPDYRRLLAQPWVGASWEGFVIEQIIQTLATHDAYPKAFFFRTSDGIEIDLLLDFGTCTWAVEVKLTASPRPADMDQLRKAAGLIGADRRVLVSQVKTSSMSGKDVSCNLIWLIKHIAGMLP